MDYQKRVTRLKQQLNSLTEDLDRLSEDLQSREENNQGQCSSKEEIQDIMKSVSCYLALNPKIEDDSILTMILQCAMYVVRGRGAGLTLYDPAKEKLMFKAAIGDGASGTIGYEVPLQGSVHGLAFATGEIQASAQPLHKDIEKSAKVGFRNVLVAPLIVDTDCIGTLSAVNKENGEDFTIEDKKAYKLFADLSAHFIQQRLREQILGRLLLKGDKEAIPEALESFQFSENNALLFGIVQAIGKMAQNRDDLLPLFKQLIDLLMKIFVRLDWSR